MYIYMHTYIHAYMHTVALLYYIFAHITLTYKRDIIFFISISVISKFTELSVYFILIYIHLFISHYF